MTDKQRSFETKLIHAGEPRPRIHGAVVMPIFQSSTVRGEFFKGAPRNGMHPARVGGARDVSATEADEPRERGDYFSVFRQPSG